MKLKRVVVTGLGAVTPLGGDVITTWDNALKGVSGAGPITQFDTSNFKTKFACEVKNFDPSTFMDRKEVRKSDRYSQFALASAIQAIEDSGMDLEKENKDRIGVIFSSGIGGIQTFDQELGNFYSTEEIIPRFNPFFIPKMISDIAAGHISMKYGFRGPNFGTVSACASSTNGAIMALDSIRLGRADVIIVGGAEAPITYSGVGGFNALQALSTRNDSPETASRPFSPSRDGFVMGEGSVCLIFEELEHALARGAKIYAEVAGGGMSADAHHLTASHPDGLGAKLVMKAAMEDADMKPEEMSYINVHGTSTPVGDPSELKAIKEVFGDHAYNINISSTKSMTGHLLGAAGALEAMFCVLAVQNDIIPPTINYDGGKDPEIDYDLNLTFGEPQKREVNYALSNTFGFGGHNACIILKKFKE